MAAGEPRILISFAVDSALLRTLRANDHVHIVRTWHGGIGLSIVREGELVAAVGAVTKIPLGSGVSAYLPRDRVREAEQLFQGQDSEFFFPEWPVELRVGDVTKTIFYGRRTLGQYQFWVLNPLIVGTPGIEECASIERLGICPEGAAYGSAELMAREQRQREPPGMRVWWQTRL